MNSKKFILFFLAALAMGGCERGGLKEWILAKKAPIKVGILHSLTGTMAASEKPVIDATLLAIEEINSEGGLLGRKIEPIVADGKSDPDTFAKEAERLITQEKVGVVFGCWTSASRKTVKPVFEKYDHLLFYPVQYEGLEMSPNIVYTGAAPNQQIVPAVKWAFDHLGKKFFLVGSDYVFPRAANAIIKDQIEILGGKILGEEYVLLGGKDFGKIADKIKETRPDVILNTVSGDSNLGLFDSLHRAEITSEKVPMISFSITENELQDFREGFEEKYGKEEDSHMFSKHLKGSYTALNYFQGVDSPENRRFVEAFKAKYGSDRGINDPMEAAYFGVYLWAQAVNERNSVEVKEVKGNIRNQCMPAPEGIVCIDDDNQHTWKTVRVGKVNQNGQFDIVWSSERPIRPIPYFKSRLKADWDDFLTSLYLMWDRSWENSEVLKGIEEKRNIKNVKLIETLAKHPTVISTAEAFNRENADLISSDIRSLDQDWENSRETDSFIASFLSNDGAKVLLKFREDNPQFKEIFITGAAGFNAAITNKTSDYYQADEDWWQEAYSSGKGKVLVSDTEYDTSSRAWGSFISAPIYDQHGNIAGIMKSILGF